MCNNIMSRKEAAMYLKVDKERLRLDEEGFWVLKEDKVKNE